jgi:Pvc16 N-terminal domain/Carboxypeptidase regulatory-like domain
MLNLVDRVIEKVLDTGWKSPPTKPGFFFTIPDEEWKKKVLMAAGVRLNIYLYEVRENLDMRRSQWDVITLADNSSVLSRPPAYFDCHYLLSAWSASEDSEAVSPMLDEHEVLSEALRIIMRNPDVVPAALPPTPGVVPLSVFGQAHVYLTVAPPEAPRVLNDFWSTMKLPWRPAIQLVATAPLDLLLDSPPSPPMTTFIQRYGHTQDGLALAGTIDEYIQIGGWVISDVDDSPIAGATVQRVGDAGAVLDESTTDSAGRYTFIGLRRGFHTVRASADGVSPKTRVLNIPDGPQGDLVFALS